MSFESDFKRCEECGEPTRRVSGLWDGVDENGNDVGGCFFDCNNIRCAIKQKREEVFERGKAELSEVAEQNERCGVSAAGLRKMRHSAYCSVRTAAEIAGVAFGDYTAMECGRKAIPLKIYRGLELVFGVMAQIRRDGGNV